MINTQILETIEKMADELGINVMTLDEIVGDEPVIDVANDDIVVLSIQLCGDSEMPEVDDEMIARLEGLVSIIENEDEGDVTIFPLMSKTVTRRVLSALPENTEIALMME